MAENKNDDQLFSLEIPNAEEVKEEVTKELAITEAEKTAIATTSNNAVDKIMAVDINNLENRKQVANIINDFGLDDLKKSKSNNSILQKRLMTFDKAGQMTGIGEVQHVTQGLEDLTIKMKDLDPSGIDFVKTGPLSKIFNPVRRYFEKYKTADQEIGTIVESLNKGKKSLQQDNTTLEIEEVQMRETTRKMLQNVEMGQQLDAALEAAIEKARLDGTDPDKIRFVEEEVLYPLRQRIEDFQQVALVSQQGVIAMEIIRRNNKELVRSVERAENVTVTALRTAVTVAGALYNQKIVLEKVQSLNETTNKMMETTATMLHTQGVEIQKQASSTAIDVQTLQTVFSETLQALEDISNYKQEALPQMKSTIETFRQMADQGEAEITKMEKTFTDIDLLPGNDAKKLDDGNKEA